MASIRPGSGENTSKARLFSLENTGGERTCRARHSAAAVAHFVAVVGRGSPSLVLAFEDFQQWRAHARRTSAETCRDLQQSRFITLRSSPFGRDGLRSFECRD